MSKHTFVRRNWLGLLFVVLHTLLVGSWAWIELDGAWDDMNPTMLVMAALHCVDYPLHLLLSPLINQIEQTGTYLVALLVFGGIMWYFIGTIALHTYRALQHFVSDPQKALT